MKRRTKLFIGIVLSSMLLNGCSLFKHKKSDSGAYAGTDSPLSEYPLENFSEAVGADASIFENIYFDYNKSVINSEYDKNITAISEWMKTNEKHILIEGHCDERGSDEYNLALGEERALAVRKKLVEIGIKPYRVQTISYGENKPADSGNTEAAWSKNRRAHFLISNA